MNAVAAVALIGLGEVGRVLAEDLPAATVTLTCFDTAFVDPASPASRNLAALAVARGADTADAVRDADLVVSAVTAGHDLIVAEAVARGLRPGAWFVDLNSASPRQKQASAHVIEDAGGRYVEIAVMAPVEPRRLGVPLLLGGPHAEQFAPVARALGFTDLRVFADTVGPAAATKLCRSVVVKGVEALVTEALLAARAWGVERDVLDSLSNLFPAEDWEALAAYLISRSVQHGARRAEEMTEAAVTVADTGLSPVMALATIERQRWAAGRIPISADDTLNTLLDGLRPRTTAGARR